MDVVVAPKSAKRATICSGSVHVDSDCRGEFVVEVVVEEGDKFIDDKIRSDWIQQLVGENVQVGQELCISGADCVVFWRHSLLQGLHTEIQAMQVCGKQLRSLVGHHLSRILFVPATLPSETDEPGPLDDYLFVNDEALLRYSHANKYFEAGAQEIMPMIVVSWHYLCFDMRVYYILGKYCGRQTDRRLAITRRLDVARRLQSVARCLWSAPGEGEVQWRRDTATKAEAA